MKKKTTRKIRRNKRATTQRRKNRSYKRMRGGYVRTTTVKGMLKPSSGTPDMVKNDPNNITLIGASIIKSYNDIKINVKDDPAYQSLPAIPDSPIPLNEDEAKSIKQLANLYGFEKDKNPVLVGNNQQIFLNVKELSREEFEAWLKYILEGKVYQKKLPFYTDTEFNKFKSLALSLNKLWQAIQNEQHPPPSPQKPLPPQKPQSPPPEYEQYERFDIGDLKGVLSKVVKLHILCEMCCVISLDRTLNNWDWYGLTDTEKLTISPNPYCAERRTIRKVLEPTGTFKPLDRINVSSLHYRMQTVADYIRANDIITKIVKPMLAKLDIEQIKKLFEETTQFKHIIIDVNVAKAKYKHYEFKICRSSIVDPDKKRISIPVIICTLTGRDEDGIIDFEFVYIICLEPQFQLVGGNSEEYNKEVKQNTFYKLKAEMTRMESLLGGQTWNAPTTAGGTIKQYYDTIPLVFEVSRTGSNVGTSRLRLLGEREYNEDPCTLVLKSEKINETNETNPVWKAAQTVVQIAAFKLVAEYLRKENNKKLDDITIRVFKISNDKSEPDPDYIAVFVEVKELDQSGGLLRVDYQALGGERYEVYKNSSAARAAAAYNKDHYLMWVKET